MFIDSENNPPSTVVSCALRRCVGSRRLLSSPAPGAAAGGVQSQGQLHRGKKEEGKERRLWPYLKAAKQQFFNVVVAALAVVMAVKMVEGNVRPHYRPGSFLVPQSYCPDTTKISAY